MFLAAQTHSNRLNMHIVVLLQFKFPGEEKFGGLFILLLLLFSLLKEAQMAVRVCECVRERASQIKKRNGNREREREGGVGDKSSSLLPASQA